MALKNRHQIYYLLVNEEREILLRDRHLDAARTQNDKMKDLSQDYGLKVDTSRTNSFASAKKILEFIP